jgi:hypothetical protein
MDRAATFNWRQNWANGLSTGVGFVTTASLYQVKAVNLAWSLMGGFGTGAFSLSVSVSAGAQVESALKEAAMQMLLYSSNTGASNFDITVSFYHDSNGNDRMRVQVDTVDGSFTVPCADNLCAAAEFVDTLYDLINDEDLWQGGHLGISNVR